jgi:hypothetical protein
MAVTSNLATTRDAQQAAFDSFRLEYATERPHEALEEATPSSGSPGSGPSTSHVLVGGTAPEPIDPQVDFTCRDRRPSWHGPMAR